MPASPATTVLLIDDDPASRRGLAILLQGEGFRVLEAASGEEGLRLARQGPDLVLLDIVLPGISGFDVCQALRADPATANLLVIQLSGHLLTSEDRSQGLEGGADAYLTKPVEPRELLAQVRALLRLHLAEEALRESEQRYRRLLASVTDYIYTVHIEGGRAVGTSHGPGCEAVTGYPPSAFADDPGLWLRMVAEEDRQAVLDQAAQLLAGETAAPLEHRLVRRNGTVRWIRNTPVLHRDPAGAVTGYDGLISDITERREAEEARQKGHALLRALIEGTTDAVFVKDRQGRYLMINEAGARFLGRDVQEVLGKDDSEVFSPATGRAIMEADRGVMDSGVAQMFEDVGTAAGVTRTYLSTKAPYRDPEGRVVGVLGISRDITERKRAEQRRTAEHAVTRTLAESSGLAEAAPRLLEALCESLGWHWGALWEVDRQAALLRCIGFWHPPVAEVPEFEATTRLLAFARGTGLPGRVWAEAQPAWIPDVLRDGNFIRAAEAARNGLHAALAFPLLRRGEVLGVLEFFNAQIQEPDRDLLDMMGSIGSQISQFIERRDAERALHQREQELRLAQAIQAGLLPRRMPEVPGFDIAGASQPAQETGGDYFDFFGLLDGSLAVAVGDAAGHGIGAALLMAETRAYLRALALAQADIAGLLALTNARLTQDVTGDFFVTLFLARIDPQGLSLTYTSGGHTPGFVLDAGGRVKVALPSTACPLGIDPEVDFPVAGPVALEPGDVLLLLTDGILETLAPAGGLFGNPRALEVIRANQHRPARAMVEALMQAVWDFSGGLPVLDDLTAVVLKVGKGE